MNEDQLKQIHARLKVQSHVVADDAIWLWNTLVVLCVVANRNGPNAIVLKELGKIDTNDSTG